VELTYCQLTRQHNGDTWQAGPTHSPHNGEILTCGTAMGPKREKSRQYLVCLHFVQNGPSEELPTQLFKSRLLQATKAPVSLCQGTRRPQTKYPPLRSWKNAKKLIVARACSSRLPHMPSETICRPVYNSIPAFCLATILWCVSAVELECWGGLYLHVPSTFQLCGERSRWRTNSVLCWDTSWLPQGGGCFSLHSSRRERLW
jgi:hypothetical protein